MFKIKFFIILILDKVEQSSTPKPKKIPKVSKPKVEEEGETFAETLQENESNDNPPGICFLNSR